MILIRSQGQLGNQMFLFSAAKKVADDKEWLIAFGFLELAAVLPKRPKRVIWVPVPHRFDRPVKKFFKRLRVFASRFCHCALVDCGATARVERSHGCRWPLVFEFGLCQDENLAPAEVLTELVLELRENSALKARVSKKIGNSKIVDGSLGFCHVRLGDYRDFTAHGASPVLPASYYTRSLGELKSTAPDVPIVVLSDDVTAAQEMLSEEAGLFFPDLDTQESFWVMMNSDFGILSASTFSWWGARFASADHRGPYLAPEYWMGFRRDLWFPSEKIRASFLQYRSVTPE